MNTSKEILSKEIYLNGDYSIGRLLEIIREKGYMETSIVDSGLHRKETKDDSMFRNLSPSPFGGSKDAEYRRSVEMLDEIYKNHDNWKDKVYYVLAFLYDSQYDREDIKKMMEVSKPKKGKAMRKGGEAKSSIDEKEMLDDIAWDIGISHKFIEGDKWKNDDMKTKAYKMAELELIKYGKGGKAKSISTGSEIDWLITGSK